MEEKNTEKREELHFDYKNIALLKEYLNPHARILSRKRTALSARSQRELAKAVKRARQMALIPFISR